MRINSQQSRVTHSNSMPSDALPHSPPAVKIEQVSFSYPPSGLGDEPISALDHVSFEVAPGSRLGILGPNGGGKSTLIKLILGLLQPTSGAISVFGRSPIAARDAGLIGYLPQRPGVVLQWPLSARQVIEMPLACRKKPWQKLGVDEHESISESISLLGLEGIEGRRIGSLSGGQLQRVLIARAISTRPKLLILDEPTVGVDISGQQRFAALIDTLNTRLGLTTIVVTHDMRALVAVADRVACLSRSLHFHDSPDGLTPSVLAQVFAHDIEPILGHLHIDAHAAQDCDDPSHHPGCSHDSCSGGGA